VSPDLLITIIILVVGFIFLAVLISKKLTEISQKSQADQTLTQWLQSMQAAITQTQKTLNDALRTTNVDMTKTLQENTRQLNQRLDNAAAVIKDVSREVGQMSEIGRGMRELQDFLKSPKLRGNIGEQVLKDLIAQMFPQNSFHLQYQFKSGDKVDAAIVTDAGILPIDSKFPMENFLRLAKEETAEGREVAHKEFIRDVKKHIDTISKKYILPDEGTMDFALMYIPSESVFYEIINLSEVTEYARHARVYPVSPSTLYAHLQMILLSFEGKKIQGQSREIAKLLRAIQGDYGKVQENLDVLGRHIANSASQFHNVSSGFTLMGQKLTRASSLDVSPTPPPQKLEKPH
jgi:DNA recombination protein RmuC